METLTHTTSGSSPNPSKTNQYEYERSLLSMLLRRWVNLPGNMLFYLLCMKKRSELS